MTPWYAETEPPQKTRPDLYRIAAYNDQPLDLDQLQYLKPDRLDDAKELIQQKMTEAALEDFAFIYQAKQVNLELLDAVDKYFDRAKIAALIEKSDPSDFSNAYLVTVCEFGVLLGQLFCQHEGFGWLYAQPYFHSIIVHEKTGIGITVFDWALKKFSEYGVDDGYVAKFHAAFREIKKIQ